MNSFHQSSTERGPFFGQIEQPQKTLLKQENQIVQDPFLEFMKSQKEILRRWSYWKCKTIKFRIHSKNDRTK